MSKPVHTLTVSTADSGQRIDKFLAQNLSELSRSRIQALLAQGHISENGAAVSDASRKVKAGQIFSVSIPETAPSHIEAQEIPLDIVYEDDHLLVINKPAGLTVHPAPGHPDMTLVNALLAHCGESLSGIGGVARPGIVHRIDKETSGLLVVAKNDAAHASLSQQLSSRSLKRTYAALVWGTPKPAKGTITGNIGRSPKNRKKMAVLKSGGKEAITHYAVLQSFTSPAVSLVECRLETGRTHQIRVHLSHIGHALVGDPVYGQTMKSRLMGLTKSLPESTRKILADFNRQALHARALKLIHPVSGKELSFECALPDDMLRLLSSFR